MRVAVVGAGRMARHHLRAIQGFGAEVRLVGVADPSGSARQQALAPFPEATGSDSLGELLTSEDVDVVHVCTPMETHAEVARQALDAGCHVYVEKPVAQTIEELEPLLKRAEGRGLRICAGHQVLFERPYRRLIELLAVIGKPVHVESYFSFRPVRTAATGGTPLTQAEQLLDVLPHPTYLLLDLLERAAPEHSGAEHLQLQVSDDGTVHGLLRRGPLTGTLVATLEGRPVEHWLRVVGTNGSVQADFVRGIVHELLGPGTSGIDKALNPLRMSRQLGMRTTAALARRVAGRGGSYPGLQEIFSEFYRSIRTRGPSPTSVGQIRGTVRVCAEVRTRLLEPNGVPAPRPGVGAGRAAVLVTGGTGLLGREVALVLASAGYEVRVVSRRIPSARKRIPGVEYRTADLSEPLPHELFAGVSAVAHCAAETAGGWDQHRRNSMAATENLLRATAQASVPTFVHVSSVAVLAPEGRDGRVRDGDPLHPNPERLGPYTWGKAESERVAVELAGELGICLRVLRPVPLIDGRRFEPPGRLGRRLSNLYVAIGSPRERLVVADVVDSARAVAAVAVSPANAPPFMNLVPPDPPNRGELVRALRESSPEVAVVWLPRFLLHPLSWAAVLGQKLLRPRRPAVRVAPAFAAQEFEPGESVEWMRRPIRPALKESDRLETAHAG